jgi:hypothetical protein
VAEGARLESVFTGNRNVGSNPTPSARLQNIGLIPGGTARPPSRASPVLNSIWASLTTTAKVLRETLPKQ